MQEVEKFISDNEQMRVNVTRDVYYNQRDIINNSYRLLNGKFTNNYGYDPLKFGSGSDIDSEGFVDVFTRKSWIPYRTAVQGVDLDIKDAKVSTNTFNRQFALDILKMIYHSHMIRTGFGVFLDDIKESTIWFGSTVTKRVSGTVEKIDWRNYITEANQPDPQKRRHAEMFEGTYEYALSNKKNWDNWDEVEELWERMQQEGVSSFNFVDFWTWEEQKGKTHKVCKRYLDRSLRNPDEYKDKTQDFGHLVPLDTFITPYIVPTIGKEEKKLYGSQKEMFPYNQFDLFKLDGRTLSLGFGELLAMPEMMYDELFNMKRRLDLKALSGIYVHQAIQSLNGKLSTLTQDAISGIDMGSAIITLAPGESLNVLPFDTKGNDFAQMEEKIYELMLQLTGITAQGTGQTVAASTSATQIQDNRLVENKVYEYIKERLHHGLNRLMRDGYAQDMIEQLEENEFIAIVGNPLQMRELDKILTDNAINDWVSKTKNATGLYPSDEEIIMVRQQIESDLQQLGSTRFPEIKKELFKDINGWIEWNFVDESVDMKQRFDTLNAIKNDQSSTKSKAKIEDEMISLAGLNPMNYDKTPEEVQAEQAMMSQQQVTTPMQ